MKKGLYHLIYTCLIFLAGFASYAQTGKTGINKVPETTLDVHGDIRGDSSLSIGPTNDTDGDSTIFMNNGRLGIGTSSPSGQFEVVSQTTVAGSTADQTGSGTAWASSEYSSSFSADKAFDDNLSSRWFASINVTVAQLRYDFGTGNQKIVTEYKIHGVGSYSPKDWTFEGSHDNSTWTVLDTKSGEYPSPSILTSYAGFGNMTAYRYYRLNITAGNDNSYLAIREVELIDSSSYTVSKEGLKVDDGSVTISGAYTLPTADGSSSGQVMTTDGSGNLSWIAPTANTDNQNLSISGNTLSISGGTGVTLPTELPAGGSNGEILQTDGSGNLSWVNKWNKSGNDLTYIAGSVGIGTSSPSGQFEVVGRSLIAGSTADQTGSGTAWASSQYSGTSSADKAFDNDLNTTWSSANNVTIAQLRYDFGAGNGKVINQYRVTGANYGLFNFSPKNWTFQGSNDASNWTVLDTRTGQSPTGNLPYTAYSNTTAYRYYRLNITASNSSLRIGIHEVELIASNDYTISSQGLRIDDDGSVTISGAYTLPTADGSSSGQVITTDGSGNLSWATPAAGGNQNLSLSGNSLSISGGTGVTLPRAVGWSDNRGAAPGEFSSTQMSYAFGHYNNISGAYADLLVMRGWYDGSGGSDNMLSIRRSGGIGMRIYQQNSGSSTNFSNYKEAVLAEPNGNVSLNGITALNNNELRLRTITDASHALQWTNNFAGISVDGPALYGWNGGVLGSTNGGQKAILRWRSNGNVGIGTANPTERLHIKKDGGLISMLESNAGSSIWTYHNYGSTLKAAAGWRGGSSNYYSVYVNGSDRFVIKENGNIGIGTTNPNSALHVVGNRDNTPDAAGVHIGQGGTNDYAIDIAAGGTSNSSYIDFTTPGVDFRGRLIYSHGSNSMSFYTNGTQRMVIDGSGQTLLYGRAALNDNELRLRTITDPNHGLRIAGGGAANFASINVDGPALYGWNGGVLGSTNGGQKAILRWRSNGNVGIGTANPNSTLHVVGNIQYSGTLTQSSDIRLKENFKSIDSVLYKVKQLQGLSYNLKADSTKARQYGVIAQEIQKVFPNMVSIIDADSGYIGVSYTQLIPVLLEAVKELANQSDFYQGQATQQQNQLADQSALYESEATQQQQRMEGLETENAKLKADNEAMQATLQSILNRMDKIEAHAGQAAQSASGH